MPDDTPEKLVRGWDEVYGRILTQFLADLKGSEVAKARLVSQSRAESSNGALRP